MSVLHKDFDYAPFNQIKNSDYLNSIRLGIKELNKAKKLSEKIRKSIKVISK